MTLLSGSAVALFVSYLAQPILTRLYTPEAFGLADYFIGVMSVLIAVASMRYEDALMTPESDREAADVWWLSAVLTCGVVLLLTLAVPFRDTIAEWVGSPLFAPFVWLFAPALLLMRLSRLSDLWLARRRKFRLISAGDVANKLSMTGIRIGAGATGPAGAGGLIGGFVAGHAVSAVVYVTALVRGRHLPGIPSIVSMAESARRFRRYPIFTMPSALLGALISRLPILLLPLFFAFDVVGQFGRAFIVLAVPLGVIGGAIAQVFFVASAEARNSGTLPRLASTVHSRLVMIGLYPTVALVIAGPDIFAFVLGQPWRDAGEFVQLIGPWLFLGGVAAPLSRLFDVLERQRADLATSVFMFATLLAAMIIGGRTGNIVFTLALVGAAGTLARVVQLGVIMRIAGVDMRSALKPYGVYAAACIPGVALLLLAALRYEMPLAAVLAAATGGILYLGIFWLLERPLDAPT